MLFQNKHKIILNLKQNFCPGVCIEERLEKMAVFRLFVNRLEPTVGKPRTGLHVTGKTANRRLTLTGSQSTTYLYCLYIQNNITLQNGYTCSNWLFRATCFMTV